jgi:hypothetical protein
MTKRKRCVFCGCSDCKISGEHAWPNWSRKLVAPPGISTVAGFRERNEPLGSVVIRSADDMGVKVKDVCKVACNEGWMHRLETQVEPMLTPLIRDGSAAHFSHEEQGILAQWALKTVMVFEFTSKEPPFYTFDERKALRQGHLASSAHQTLIWASHYTGRHMSISHGVRIGFDMHAKSKVLAVDARCASVSLGQFLFQTFTFRMPDETVDTMQLLMTDSWQSRTVLLWPVTPTPFAWPPPDPVDDAGFQQLATRFQVAPIKF